MKIRNRHFIKKTELKPLKAEILKHYDQKFVDQIFPTKSNVELIETGEGWSPYLSLEDAGKLDDVREALRREDVDSASKAAKVYRLTPVN